MDISRERERDQKGRVVFRGTARFGKKTVSLRSSHNAYLEGAWSTNRLEVVNSTMETNKASNLRRMPLNVLLINLFGDGVNLALRWYISVSPKLCLTRLSKTWKRLCRVLRSNKFTTVYNSVFTCTLLVKLYNKNTSDRCSNLTDHTYCHI